MEVLSTTPHNIDMMINGSDLNAGVAVSSIKLELLFIIGDKF